MTPGDIYFWTLVITSLCILIPMPIRFLHYHSNDITYQYLNWKNPKDWKRQYECEITEEYSFKQMRNLRHSMRQLGGSWKILYGSNRIKLNFSREKDMIEIGLKYL